MTGTGTPRAFHVQQDIIRTLQDRLDASAVQWEATAREVQRYPLLAPSTCNKQISAVGHAAHVLMGNTQALASVVHGALPRLPRALIATRPHRLRARRRVHLAPTVVGALRRRNHVPRALLVGQGSSFARRAQQGRMHRSRA